ncbi:N-6 DNA methylase (plasmid) [Calothrix sp. NIES-4101]|nr:N-6 DNA methylase [Calothrix sp. NIES-4101]
MLNTWKQEFSKKFLSIIKVSSRFDTFRDWAHLVAITCHQAPVNLGILPKDDTYERLENSYLEKVKAFDSSTLNVFAELFGIVQLAFSEAKTDFLGQLYQELEIGFQKDNGQFFTPYSVAKMTAEATITADFLQPKIEKNGFITVGEPAVGAGALLIAAAEVIEELGYDPRKHMYFEGVDVDRLCFDMAYIQMSVMGIPGRIIHGNSLSQEIWEVRKTPPLQLIEKHEEIDPSYKISQLLLQLESEELNDNSHTLETKETENREKRKKNNRTPEGRQLNLFEDL